MSNLLLAQMIAADRRSKRRWIFARGCISLSALTMESFHLSPSEHPSAHFRQAYDPVPVSPSTLDLPGSMGVIFLQLVTKSCLSGPCQLPTPQARS